MKTKMITALSLFAVACSKGGDTSPPEVSATDPRAASAPARVLVVEEGIGARGRIALFHDSLGRVISTATTDAKGIASHAVLSGDMVTIANVGSSKFELTTYIDIQPHDSMVVGEMEDEMNPGDVGSVVVAPLSNLPGAATHEISAGMSLTETDGSPVALHLFDRFLENKSTFQLLGIARAASGEPLAFSVSQGTLGSSAQIVLPAWRTDWDSVQFHVTSASPFAKFASRVDLFSGQGRFVTSPMRGVAGSEFERKIPRGLGSQMESTVELSDRGCTRLLQERGTIRHDVSIDVAKDLLPEITSVAVDSSSDAARPFVSYVIDGDANRADLVMVRLSWGDDHEWTVLAPATTTSIQIPALPDTLGQWKPTATGLRVAVALVDVSYLDGYRDAMKRGVSELREFTTAGTFRSSVRGDMKF